MESGGCDPNARMLVSLRRFLRRSVPVSGNFSSLAVRTLVLKELDGSSIGWFAKAGSASTRQGCRTPTSCPNGRQRAASRPTQVAYCRD